MAVFDHAHRQTGGRQHGGDLPAPAVVNGADDTVKTAPAPLESLGRLTWSPVNGHFIAANAEATRLWGAPPVTVLGRVPDRAMPAIARLAILANELQQKPDATACETLVFWTALGSQRWLCRLTPSAQGDCVDIDVLKADPRQSAALVPSAAVAGLPAPAALASQPNAEDALTLSEIARQIRARIADPEDAVRSADPEELALIRDGGAIDPLAPDDGAIDDAAAPSMARSGPTLLEFVNAPALLFDGWHWAINAAGLALLNELDLAALLRRGGPLLVIDGLAAAIDKEHPMLPVTTGVTVHPRGRPPSPAAATVHRLADQTNGNDVVLVLLQPESNGTAGPTDDDLRQTEFFAKVSHEVRTPLASIIGFAEVMRAEALGPIDNPKYKGYLKDILESARHALSLINDLLDLSRIRAGALSLDIVELDLNSTISAALGTLQLQAEQAGLSLSAHYQADLPHLIADGRSIKQMLLNLVGNAIKFTPSNGVITVATALTVTGEIVLAVTDTGEGMTPADVELALLPFRQVGTVPGRQGGTGLGLPLTKALAEANGAQMTVVSQRGAGTTISLTFAATRTVPV